MEFKETKYPLEDYSQHQRQQKITVIKKNNRNMMTEKAHVIRKKILQADI